MKKLLRVVVVFILLLGCSHKDTNESSVIEGILIEDNVDILEKRLFYLWESYNFLVEEYPELIIVEDIQEQYERVTDSILHGYSRLTTIGADSYKVNKLIDICKHIINDFEDHIKTKQGKYTLNINLINKYMEQKEKLLN